VIQLRDEDALARAMVSCAREGETPPKPHEQASSARTNIRHLMVRA
jgi:hypothetical protein